MLVLLSITPLLTLFALIILGLRAKKFIWSEDAFSELNSVRGLSLAFKAVILFLILAETIFIFWKFETIVFEVVFPIFLLVISFIFDAKNSIHKILAFLSFAVVIFVFVKLSILIGFMPLLLTILMVIIGITILIFEIIKVRQPYWLFEGLVMILITVWNFAVL